MNKLMVGVTEACQLTNLGRSKLLELAYRGDIPSLKVGRRRLFPIEGLRAWMRGLVADQRESHA